MEVGWGEMVVGGLRVIKKLVTTRKWRDIFVEGEPEISDG